MHFWSRVPTPQRGSGQDLGGQNQPPLGTAAGIPLLLGGTSSALHTEDPLTTTSREELCAAAGDQTLPTVVPSALTRPPAARWARRVCWPWGWRWNAVSAASTAGLGHCGEERDTKRPGGSKREQGQQGNQETEIKAAKHLITSK